MSPDCRGPDCPRRESGDRVSLCASDIKFLSSLSIGCDRRVNIGASELSFVITEPSALLPLTPVELGHKLFTS
jgi:hypothetical protein